MRNSGEEINSVEKFNKSKETNFNLNKPLNSTSGNYKKDESLENSLVNKSLFNNNSSIVANNDIIKLKEGEVSFSYEVVKKNKQ